MDVARDLLDLVNVITAMDKESFVGAFNERNEKYRDKVIPNTNNGLEGIFSDITEDIDLRISVGL